MTSHVSNLNNLMLGETKFIGVLFPEYVSGECEETSSGNDFKIWMDEFGERPLIGALGFIGTVERDSGCFGQLLKKPWGSACVEYLSSENLPFVLFIETDFHQFDPTANPWAICKRGFLPSTKKKAEGVIERLMVHVRKGHGIIAALLKEIEQQHIPSAEVKTHRLDEGEGRSSRSGRPTANWIKVGKLVKDALAEGKLREFCTTSGSRQVLRREDAAAWIYEACKDDKTLCPSTKFPSAGAVRKNLKATFDEIERELNALKSSG